LLDSRDQVLLGLRADWKATWPACWDCIGGRVEAGETLPEALTREVREEVGVRPVRFRLLGVVTGWEGGAPENVSDEHTEIRWFDFAGMSALNNLADRDYRNMIDRIGVTARPLVASHGGLRR
jgi:8-oxo-dGTP pyrophosphatase MutT (NUDIX family)